MWNIYNIVNNEISILQYFMGEIIDNKDIAQLSNKSTFKEIYLLQTFVFLYIFDLSCSNCKNKS